MFIILYFGFVLCEFNILNSITSIPFGQNRTGPQCRLGFADCNSPSKLPCEYGYFRLTQTQNNFDCVQWYSNSSYVSPYFKLIGVDELQIRCLDCLLHPLTWENNRTCTQKLNKISGNRAQTFIPQKLTNLELYLIVNQLQISQPIGRDTSIQHAVQLCDGCATFCNPVDDSTCNEISTDVSKTGIFCALGYYFNGDVCYQCNSNCQTCDSNSCKQCNDGYALNGTTCVPCFSNCDNCEFDVNLVMICTNCISNSTQVFIQSLDWTQCVACGNQCTRCEYVSKNINLPNPTHPVDPSEYANYVMRCRQCGSSDMIISYDGNNCDYCTIENCARCFYQQTKVSTLNEDFNSWDFDTNLNINLKCQICTKGFQPNTLQTKCVESSSNCLTSDVNGCLTCSEKIITTYTVVDTLKSNGKCTSGERCDLNIDNCVTCYLYTSTIKRKFYNKAGTSGDLDPSKGYQCTSCKPGYFADFFTGVCLPCQNSCSTCWDFNDTFNLTQLVQLNTVEQFSEEQLENIQAMNRGTPYCSQCLPGYTLYNNVCLGCTENCFALTLGVFQSQCTFTDTLAYCSVCPTDTQFSLFPNLSECWECPLNCKACVERANLAGFNPSNQALARYGRQCVQYDTSLATRFMDSVLGMPVECVTGSTNSVNPYCINQATISITLQCGTDSTQGDYLLSRFFKVKSVLTSIQFIKHESLSIYQTLNQKAVQNLFVNITLLGDVCNFPSASQIVLNYFENVYSIQTLHLTLIGNPIAKTIIQSKGVLQFSKVTSLILQDLIISPDTVNKKGDKNYGLQLNFDLESQVRLYRIQFQDAPSRILKVSFQNTIYLEFNNVSFQNIHTLDQILKINYTLPSLTKQTFIINGLTISNAIFKNFNLIQLVDLAPMQVVNFQANFNNCTFLSSSIISQTGMTGQLSLNFAAQISFSTINNTQLIFYSNAMECNIYSLDLYYAHMSGSVFIKGNNLKINNLYVSTVVMSDSYLITQADQYTNKTTIESILNQKLSNVVFQNLNCYNSNCIIKMNTPTNPFGILSNITINNIKLLNINPGFMDQLDSQFLESALIYITNIDTVIINNMLVDNSQGIAIIFVDSIISVFINKLLYDWSNLNYNSTGGLKPFNNLIPSTLECVNRKVKNQIYSMQLIAITKFEQTVSITNLTCQQQLFIDSQMIYIESYDIIKQNTTTYDYQETIILDHIQLYNNSLVSATQGWVSTLIRIDSAQLQKISITNCIFIQNHLQQLLSSQISDISTLILINSQTAELQIQNNFMQYNRAVGSVNGLIKITAESITITNVTILTTNVVDRTWIQRIETPNLMSDNEILTFFQILSAPSIIQIITQNLVMTQSLFQDSFGVQAGVRLMGKGVAQFFVQAKFINILSNLQLRYQSAGSALTIDATKSSMQLQILYTVMQNCTARYRGGCMLIQGSSQLQYVIIDSSTFNQCRALVGSTIYADFLESLYVVNMTMKNITIINNDYLTLLSNLPAIQAREYLYLIQSASVITQRTGAFVLTSGTFQNISLTTILRIISAKDVAISDTAISNVAIFISPLIYLSSLDGSQVQTSQLKFSNNTQLTLTQNMRRCDNLMVKEFTQSTLYQNCTIINNIIDWVNANPQYGDDDEIYELSPDQQEAEFQQYKYLTNNQKYSFSIPNFNPLQTTQSQIQLFTITNQSLVQCILSYVKYLNSQLELGNITSLLYIAAARDTMHIELTGLTIESNQCHGCYGGLIQIYNIDPQQVPLVTFIYVKQISCQNNIAGYYGCISFSSASSFTDASFSQPIIDVRLLESQVSVQQYNIRMDQAFIQGNYARVGTGVYINDISIFITDSVIADNSASLIGGGIYFIDQTGNNLYLENTIFSGNYAQAGGGLYLYNYTLGDIFKQQVIFDKNEAINGGNNIQETSYFITLSQNGQAFPIQVYNNYSGELINSSQIISYNITVNYQTIGNYPDLTNLLILPSGQPINQYKYYYSYTQEQVPFGWDLMIVNQNRQHDVIINGQPNDICNIEGRIQSQSYDKSGRFYKNFTTPSQVKYNVTLGGYDMNNLLFNFDPYFDKDHYLELRFTCPSLKIPIYNTKYPYDILNYNQNFQLFVRVRTFPCQMGEIYSGGVCKACKQIDNVYAIELNSLLCKPIDKSSMMAVSPIGLNLKQGYWRPDYTNDIVTSCFNLQANCKGGWVPGDPSCYAGHLGALCESCDLYKVYQDESYAISGPYKCGMCSKTTQLNVIIIVATSIISLITTVTSVKGTIDLLKLQIATDILKIWKIRMSQSSSDLATLIKVFTNYFQIIQVIGTFQLSIPKGVTQGAQTAGNPTGSMSSSLDCFLLGITDQPMVYFKMAWSLLMPLFYLLVIFIGYFIMVIIDFTPFNQSVIYTAIIYMFLYLHPTMVQGFISLASSRTVSQYSYVQADVGYRYDTPEHRHWLAVFIGPMLIIWAIVLPAIFFYAVFRKRNQLDTRQAKMTIGYFYKEYQRNAYLWEFVKIVQKEFMVIILVYYAEFVPVKGLLVVVILFIYGAYQVSVTPYKSIVLNDLDRKSTSICAASLSLGVLMWASAKSGYLYLEVIVVVIIGVMNLYFILIMLYYIFQGYVLQLSDVLDKIADQINEKYPNLRKHPWIQARPSFQRLFVNKAKIQVRIKALWELVQKEYRLINKLKYKYQMDFEEAFELAIKAKSSRIQAYSPLVENPNQEKLE